MPIFKGIYVACRHCEKTGRILYTGDEDIPQDEKYRYVEYEATANRMWFFSSFLVDAKFTWFHPTNRSARNGICKDCVFRLLDYLSDHLQEVERRGMDVEEYVRQYVTVDVSMENRDG